MNTKYCYKCLKTKLLHEFGKNKSTKDGLQNWCKACRANHYIENKHNISEYKKRNYQENKEHIKARVKTNYYNDPEPKKLKAKEYYKNNKVKCNERSEKWRKNNLDKVKNGINYILK